MRDPEILDFSTGEIAVETIEQFYFTVDPTRKFDLLEKLLDRENPRQVIVFCRTKRGTDKIFERLSRRRSRSSAGNPEEIACIHGDLAQSVRDRVMKQFREGAVKVLVATDVVGRGIDVSSLSHIVNYDIPEFCDDYVHRVGRTGRMGREGVAYTFVAPDEGPQLTRIEMRIEKLLKRDEIAGFEAFDRRPQASLTVRVGMEAAAEAPAEPEPEAAKKPPAAALLASRVPFGKASDAEAPSAIARNVKRSATPAGSDSGAEPAAGSDSTPPASARVRRRRVAFTAPPSRMWMRLLPTVPPATKGAQAPLPSSNSTT
jgi:superfamily II DNA/RNA helicase